MIECSSNQGRDARASFGGVSSGQSRCRSAVATRAGVPGEGNRAGASPLSSIGFLAQSSSSPSACSRPTLLFSFTLALTEFRGSWQFPGSRDGLRPGFGQQLALWQAFGGEKSCHQAQTSTHHTTQAAFWWLVSWPLAPTMCDMCSWETRASLRLLLLCLCLAADTHRPDLGLRHRQPEPLHPMGILHFAVVPAPQPAFEIFVTGFDPASHSVPTHLGLLCLQIREDCPREGSAHPKLKTGCEAWDASLQRQRQRTPRGRASLRCRARRTDLPRGRRSSRRLSPERRRSSFADPSCSNRSQPALALRHRRSLLVHCWPVAPVHSHSQWRGRRHVVCARGLSLASHCWAQA